MMQVLWEVIFMEGRTHYDIRDSGEIFTGGEFILWSSYSGRELFKDEQGLVSIQVF